MSFALTIETDNAAFTDEDGQESLPAKTSELALILRRIVRDLEGGHVGPGVIRDANGNRVGTWRLD